jgi:hypothetical protein
MRRKLEIAFTHLDEELGNTAHSSHVLLDVFATPEETSTSDDAAEGVVLRLQWSDSSNIDFHTIVPSKITLEKQSERIFLLHLRQPIFFC